VSILHAVFRDRRRFTLAVRAAVFLAAFIPQLLFGFWAHVVVLALVVALWSGDAARLMCQALRSSN
jgi:hypothetical protein